MSSFEKLAVLSAMFRPLSRSRAPRSKRHAAGTSPAHKWRSFQNFTFYWCRKELENVEFFQNSTLSFNTKSRAEFAVPAALSIGTDFAIIAP